MKRIAVIALLLAVLFCTAWVTVVRVPRRPSAAAAPDWWTLVPSAILIHDFSTDPGSGPYVDLSPVGVNTGFNVTATSPTWATNGLYFFSTSTCVYHLDTPSLTFGNGTTNYPFTVMYWLKRLSISGFCWPVSKAPTTTGTEWTLRVGGATNNGAHVAAVLYDNNSSHYLLVQTTNTPMLASNWYHIAMTCGGGSGTSAYEKVKIYIDGVEKSKWFATAGTFVAIEDTIYTLDIGPLFRTTSLGLTTNFIIDGLAVSSTDITSNQVKAVYDATAGSHGNP